MANYLVNGLDVFAEKFKDYADNFIIVGGTACSLAMNEVGIEFMVARRILSSISKIGETLVT